MRLWLDGCAELLFVSGPKTRHPLLEASLHRVEQRAGEAGRHVWGSGGKCLVRHRVNFLKDMRDLFTGKPESPTRLDEVPALDSRALVADFPGSHRKFHVLGLKLIGIQRRQHGQNIVELCHDEAAARHQRDAEVLGMPIGCADQPEKVGRATRYDLDD